MAVAINRNVVIASIVLLLSEEERKKKKQTMRSIWTRPWLQRRKVDGAFHTLFKELKEGDPEGFKGYVRMDVEHFDEFVLFLA